MFIFILSRPCLKGGHAGLKTRSVGQILEKHGVHSRWHSFNSVFIKFAGMFFYIKSRPCSKRTL